MQYPVLIEGENPTWSASVPDLHVYVTARTRAMLERRVREAMAISLEVYADTEQTAPKPSIAKKIKCQPGQSVVMLAPDEPDPVSVAVERAIKRSRLSKQDVAQRMGVSASAISRLTDPYYHGHSLESLRRLASALGSKLEVKFPVEQAAD
jgi:antitoxin HicB